MALLGSAGIQLVIPLLVVDSFKNNIHLFHAVYTPSCFQDLMFFFLCSFVFQRLARTGIIVTTSEAILLQLVADKEHPKFKEIQNLIKASAPESGLLSKV